MLKKISILLLLAFLIACSSTHNTATSKIPGARVKLTTDSGVIVLRLYNQTPLHRDNFLKLVKQHYFDSLLFHRVIKNFMIQGGDPVSKNAKPGILLGDGGPKYTIPAEFDTSLFHKKGVLAAAREGDNVNPKKASSGSQFYIVQGKKFTDAGLDSVETFRLKGRKLPLSHREVYKTIGGTPHLDMNYTVFGEVESGLEVVDKIASAARDSNNRPLNDIRMKMKIVRKK
ncbi:MAG: peptidylprolyl isomerase [Ginsengibacter sp.]